MDREKFLREMMHEFPQTMKKLSGGIRFPAGIPKQTIMLLHCIMMHDGRSMSFYSDHLLLPKSNLSAAADRLIAEGHISREADPCDRRVICLHITDGGREYMENCMRRVLGECRQRLSQLDDDDLQEMKECFDKLRSVADKISRSES